MPISSPPKFSSATDLSFFKISADTSIGFFIPIEVCIFIMPSPSARLRGKLFLFISLIVLPISLLTDEIVFLGSLLKRFFASLPTRIDSLE